MLTLTRREGQKFFIKSPGCLSTLALEKVEQDGCIVVLVENGTMKRFDLAFGDRAKLAGGGYFKVHPSKFFEHQAVFSFDAPRSVQIARDDAKTGAGFCRKHRRDNKEVA